MGGAGGRTMGMGDAQRSGSVRSSNRPPDDLVSLVAKLNLLVPDHRARLSNEQIAKLSDILGEFDKSEKMTDAQALEHLDAIRKTLTKEQNTFITSVEIRSRSAYLSGVPNVRGDSYSTAGGQMAGSGNRLFAERPASEATDVRVKELQSQLNNLQLELEETRRAAKPTNDNPFKQKENAKVLESLRGRLDARVPSPSSESKN